MANHNLVEVPSSCLAVSARRGGIEMLEEVAGEWRDLCQQAPHDEPFYHPEWIAAHIRAFTPGAELFVLMVRIENQLRLLLPLIEERRWLSGIPVRAFRTPVNSHSCRFDIVRSPGPEGDAAIRAAWEHLGKLPDWDLLELDQVPPGGGLEAIALAAQESGFEAVQRPLLPSPVVPVPADSEGCNQVPPNSKLRSQLRQVRRQLEAEGTLRLSRIERADFDALQRFYQLEASGWKGKEKSAIACDPSTQQFYQEVAESAARLGYLCLYTLELNDHLLAAHFGLCYRDTYYSPKIAIDENFKKWAPGHLIVSEILRDCCSRGIKTYDITGPHDDWKLKWTSQTRTTFTHFIFSKSLQGRLAHALRFRVRPMLKKIIQQLKVSTVQKGEKNP